MPQIQLNLPENIDKEIKHFMIDNKMYLEPSVVIALACSTCHYSGKGELFCIQGIRRGAMAQQGAVDVSYWHQDFYRQFYWPCKCCRLPYFSSSVRPQYSVHSVPGVAAR